MELSAAYLPLVASSLMLTTYQNKDLYGQDGRDDGQNCKERDICLQVIQEFSEQEAAIDYFKKVIVPAIVGSEMAPRLRERFDEDFLAELYERQNLSLERDRIDVSNGRLAAVKEADAVVIECMGAGDVLDKFAYDDEKDIKIDIEFARAELLLLAPIAYEQYQRDNFWEKMIKYFVLCSVLDEGSIVPAADSKEEGYECEVRRADLRPLFLNDGFVANDLLRRFFERDPELITAISTVLMEMEKVGNMDESKVKNGGRTKIPSYTLKEFFEGFPSKTPEGIGYFPEIAGSREQAVRGFSDLHGKFIEAALVSDQEPPVLTGDDMRAAVKRIQQQGADEVQILQEQLDGVGAQLAEIREALVVAGVKVGDSSGDEDLPGAVKSLDARNLRAEKGQLKAQERARGLERQIHEVIFGLREEIADLDSEFFRFWQGKLDARRKKEVVRSEESEARLSKLIPDRIAAEKQRRADMLAPMTVARPTLG